MSLPNALTIAGFDPSGGAGVLADVRTFATFGFRTSAAITSITFQNDQTASGASHQSAATVRGQVESLLEEFKFACAKTGMLPTRGVITEVARLFQQHELPAPVVDPVMVSSSGLRLMEANAIEVFKTDFLPVARLVTPNISEAETLSRIAIDSESDMREAARIIRSFGARAVLIKGGHLGTRASRPHSDDLEEAGETPALPENKDAGETPALPENKDAGETPALPENKDAGETPALPRSYPDEAIDVLDDEGKVTVFRAEFIRGANLHGSGCVLSAAIAAGLGQGMSLEESVRRAKNFLLEALRACSLESNL